MTATADLCLSKVIRSPLISRAGDRLGRVRDVVALLREGETPLVLGVVARIGNRDVFVPAREIAGFEPGALHLAVDRLDLRGFERRPHEVLLAADVLRHHVINLRDARLVPVNDVGLERRGDELHVTGIYAGTGGLLGRLLLRGRRQTPAFVEWAGIEPLLGHVPTVRRRLPFTRLARLHPAELADMVEAASPREGEEILQAVGQDPELEADVFEELDLDYQVELLRARPDREAAEILANVSPDDAADIVTQLDQEHRDRVLGLLPLVQLQKIRMLLGYNPEIAGGLMSPDFLTVPSDMTVAEALDAIRSSNLPPAALGTVFIADDAGRLAGAVPAVEILRRDPADPMADLASRDPVSVRPHTDIPEIAVTMADFNLEALPVVDDEHRLVGVVTVDDLLEVVLPQDWRIRVQHYPSTDRDEASSRRRPPERTGKQA